MDRLEVRVTCISENHVKVKMAGGRSLGLSLNRTPDPATRLPKISILAKKKSEAKAGKILRTEITCAELYTKSVTGIWP